MQIYKKLLYLFLAILLLSINFLPAVCQEKPHVILISFDGFRWDYAHRNITQNLNRMAKNGVSALSLMPVFPTKTFPNHYSIITGLYPQNHGIIYNDFINPFSGQRYKVGDTLSVREARWYWGEALWETAERQGLITASYFWPGSEVGLAYRKPSYVEYYDHHRAYEKRIEGVLNWLQYPEEKRPHFITLYFDATDTYGHDYGPDSPETNKAIRRLDDMLGLLLAGLEKIQFLQKTNVIVVSDNGMTAIDNKKTIHIERMLKNYNCQFQGYGPIMMVDGADENIQSIYDTLKQHEKNYKVYLREDVPSYFHFSNHPFISPIIIIADLGWSLTDDVHEKLLSESQAKGNHGYDNFSLDMHGIFYAMGPAFKTGYRTGTLWTIDIYPLICEILEIFPRQNIDGKLERIQFILKD